MKPIVTCLVCCGQCNFTSHRRFFHQGHDQRRSKPLAVFRHCKKVQVCHDFSTSKIAWPLDCVTKLVGQQQESSLDSQLPGFLRLFQTGRNPQSKGHQLRSGNPDVEHRSDFQVTRHYPRQISKKSKGEERQLCGRLFLSQAAAPWKV